MATVTEFSDSDSLESNTNLLISHDDPWYYSLIQGWTGGLITVLAGHPFDTVRVRLQTGTVKHLFRNLYCGVSPPLMFTTLSWSANIWAYQSSLKLLNKLSQNKINEENKIQHVFAAGALSGVIWGTCVCPIELVRCYSQNYHINASTAISDMGSKFGRFNALKLLYRGYPTTLCRDILGCSIYFGTMELTRKYLPNYSQSTLMQFIGGSLTMFATWAFILPIDMVKSNIQTEFALYGKQMDLQNNYKNIPSSRFGHNLKVILKRHNWNIFRLWNGSAPMVGRVIVCGGLNIVYQEYMVTHLLHAKSKD